MEPQDNRPGEKPAPFFADEVDEVLEFLDHDTRGEPGYVPPLPPLIPRIELPPADARE